MAPLQMLKSMARIDQRRVPQALEFLAAASCLRCCARLIQNRLSHLADGEYDPRQQRLISFFLAGVITDYNGNSRVYRDVRCIKPELSHQFTSCPKTFQAVIFVLQKIVSHSFGVFWGSPLPWHGAPPFPPGRRTSTATSSDPGASVRAPAPWPSRWRRCLTKEHPHCGHKSS